MKQLLVILMMALVLPVAAQNQVKERCQAITKKGTQCKRNAKEGMKYCWQHVASKDHVKEVVKEAKAKKGIKDDGTCMAQTQDGDRCKRKAAAGSNYCTQHQGGAAKKVYTQCQATTQDGDQCKRKPVEGGKFCAQHEKSGAKPAAKAEKKEAKAEKKEAKKEAPVTQCQAKTQAGDQCKRKPVAGGKFCAQHAKAGANEAKAEKKETKAAAKADKKEAKADKKEAKAADKKVVKCQAKTKEGKPCSRNAVAGGKFCAQHSK